MKITRVFPIYVLLTVLFFSAYGETQQQKQGTNAVRRIKEAYARLENAKTNTLKVGSIQAKSALLIDALNKEISEPVSDKRSNSYLSNTEFLRLKYVEELSALGPEALSDLRSASTNVRSAVKPYIEFARANLRDRAVATNILSLAASDPDPFVRAMAVRSLGRLGDSNAVSFLKQLLQDPYFRESEDSLGGYRTYLIREEAARALIQLGYDIKRTDGNFEASSSPRNMLPGQTGSAPRIKDNETR